MSYIGKQPDVVAVPGNSSITNAQVAGNAAIEATKLGFTQSGTGAVAQTVNSKLLDVVSVKDFGAVGNADFAGNGTDDTAAFQAAINTGKTVFVPKGTYKITSTLQLLNGYKALVGEENLPVLVKTTAGPAIKIGITGSNLNEYSTIQNFYLRCTVTPTFPQNPGPNDAAVVLDGSGATSAAAVQNAKVQNVRVGNWSTGFYCNDTVGTYIERCFVQLLNDYSASPGFTIANKFIGFVLDCTPFTSGGISPQASIKITECDVVGNGTPSSATSAGYYIVGSDIRDIFTDTCETANTSYGFWIVATGNDYNWDVQINLPIIDAYKTNGIRIDGADGPGCITVNGGYFVGSSNAGPAIYGINSAGITVTGGCQILGITNDSSTDDGVRFDNCSKCSIIGNSFQNCNYAISLLGSSYCTVTGNHIFASATDTEPNPTLIDAIRLTSTSTFNSVIGNVISGKDATDVYTYGLNIDSGSANNILIGNTINTTSVAIPVNIGDATTTVLGSSATTLLSTNITLNASTALTLNSNGSVLTLKGNNATAPIAFQDGFANTVARITNNGGYLFGTSDRGIYNGAGSPEGAITATAGALYLRTNGGTGTTLYVKETGTGNTGWVAK